MLLLLALACHRAPEPYPLEFLEAPQDPSARLPMIVAIHGNNGHPERMLSMVASCGLTARVVAPRAPRESPGGFSWFDIRLPSKPSWDVPAAGEMADRIGALVRRLAVERPTAGKPVLTGFSQGGVLALAVNVREAEAVGGAVVVSATFDPGLLPDPVPTAIPPIRAIAPELDPLVPPTLTEGVIRRFQKQGADATLTVLPGVAHGFGREAQPAWCEALGAVLAAAG